MEELSEEQQQEVKDVFEVIDENQSGSIDANELAKGLRGLGLNPTMAEVKELLDEFDADNNKVLSLDEFAKLYVKCMSNSSNTEDILREQFKKLDTDGNGKIDAEELRKVLLYGEEKLDEEEAQKIIAEFDTNGDGAIDLEEFINGVLGRN